MFFKLNHNLFLLIMLKHITCYENSTKICETKCKCSSEDDSFVMVCKEVHFSLANWPELINASHTNIEANFSGNSISRLEAMPATNLSLAVIYDHCNITELGFGLFENAINVTYVDLSYNLLNASEFHSGVFKGPYNNTSNEPIALEHLNLAYNTIHSFRRDLFEHMLGLKWLNLEGNHFRIIDTQTAEAIAKLTKLEYFNIANNNLVHLNELTLKPMKSLNILIISQNEFDLVPLAIQEVGSSLKRLYMDDCDIMEFNGNTFLGMTELTEISVKNLKSLVDIKTNAFSPLKNLRKINLSGMNGLVKIDDEAFGNITNIRELNLSHSNLKSLPINLVNWTELRSLDLKQNLFSCECYWMNITSRLPEEIKIERDGPRCYNNKRHRSYEIFSLTPEICYKMRQYGDLDTTSHKSRMIRITLLVVSSLLLLTIGFGLWLKFGSKFLKIRSNRARQFSSSVIYNPIATNSNF